MQLNKNYIFSVIIWKKKTVMKILNHIKNTMLYILGKKSSSPVGRLKVAWGCTGILFGIYMVFFKTRIKTD